MADEIVGSQQTPAQINQMSQQQPEQQIANVEAPQPEITTTQTEVAQAAPAQPSASPTPQESFRALREKAERAERERDQAMEILRNLERNKQVQQSVQEDKYLNPDDLVEAKYVDNKIKRLEEQLKQYQQQTYTQTAEARLKAQYPDIEKVVSADNIQMLKATYPELAQSIDANSDLYSKAASAYTLIKKLGIYQEDVYAADRERVQINAAKPKPSAAIAPQQGNTPLSKANQFAGSDLTPDLQKQLYKEMMEARKFR